MPTTNIYTYIYIHECMSVCMYVLYLCNIYSPDQNKLLLMYTFSESDFHSSHALLHRNSFPVAQLVEHGVSNAKIMGSIPRESKS